jgi:hypothetical protein
MAGGMGLYRTQDFFWRQFAVGREGNLFTWYSSFLLTAAAIAALANFWLDGRRRGISRWRFAWLGVFLVMIVVSLEEVARFHEIIQIVVPRWAGKGSTSQDWLWRGGRVWVMLYSPAIVAVIVFFFLTFSQMFRGYVGPRNLALGGLCLWIAVVVLEFFYVDLVIAWGYWYGGLESFFEEAAEIFGSTAMLVAFLWYGHDGFNELIDHAPERSSRTS